MLENLSLDGKSIVITGGGTGLGREMTLAMARAGADIVIASRRTGPIEEVADKVREMGRRAITVSTDVTDSAQVNRLIERSIEEFGKVDVLLNNAGIMDSRDGDSQQTTEEVWERTLAVNLRGVFLGCKYGIPAMRRAGGGSVVNTASFVACLGAATPQIAYTASKGGVLAMTRELAVVHARENIRVNALCPGPLRTELLMKFLDTDEKKQRRLVHIPVGRFGRAAEMAQAALYLASDESSYVTGTEFVVDGGITAAYVTPE